jgi:hypothetical protein
MDLACLDLESAGNLPCTNKKTLAKKLKPTSML